MRRVQQLYWETPPALGLEADLSDLVAAVINLSLALLPLVRWQKAQASVKLNVGLDVRNDLPVFASLHEGNRSAHPCRLLRAWATADFTPFKNISTSMR